MDTELKRTLTGQDYFTLAFGTIVGAGWVIAAGSWLERGGSLGAALAFGVGGAVLISVGACYAEMCAAMPSAGGPFEFCLRALGRRPAFIVGWLLAGGYIALCPWEAIAVGRIVSQLWPLLSRYDLYSIMGTAIAAPQLTVSIGLTLAIAWLNCQGASSGLVLQKIAVRSLIIVCSAMLVIGFLAGRPSNLRPFFVGRDLAAGAAGFASVLVNTPFFFNGFDSIAHEAEESSSDLPPNRLGVMVMASIIAATIFYVAIIIAVAMAAPQQALIGEEFPAAEAFAICCASSVARTLILIAGMLGLISALNGCFLSASRVLLTMGREGLLPGILARINPRTQTPNVAIGLVCIISLAGCFLGAVVMQPVVDVASLFFVTAWEMVCIACLKLRITDPDMARPYQMRHGWLVSSIAILLSATIIWMMIYPSSPGSLDWPIDYAVVATWLFFGIITYLTSSSRSAYPPRLS